jgi:hypothetical protein
MRKKAIRAAAASFATLAAAAVGVLAVPLPASAQDSGSMCESNSNYCLNTANFNLYTSVTESKSGARTINALLQFDTTYKLQFAGSPSKCVGVADSGIQVEIKPCSGNYVLWTWTQHGDGLEWANGGSTGTTLYLTGTECGCQYTVKANNYRGGYQAFTGPI